MSYSVTFDRRFNNRYIVPLDFGKKEDAKAAIIDTACSTTLVPTSIAEQFSFRYERIVKFKYPTEAHAKRNTAI